MVEPRLHPQQVLLDDDKLACSICLDTLRVPVTIACGHNYCARCIDGYWEKNEQLPKVRCPQCRETFDPRPDLKKNLLLGELVEILRKAKEEGVIPDKCYAGPADVGCDSCEGRRLKANETCLQCMTSFCSTHVLPHYKHPAFKNHKLVKLKPQGASSVQDRIREREEEVDLLEQEVDNINHSADKAVRESDAIFAELISAIDRRRSRTREQLRSQQRHEFSRAEAHRRAVERTVGELKGKHTELQQLSRTEDPVHVQHSYTSLCRIGGDVSKYRVSIHDRPLRHFDDVTKAVTNLTDRMAAALKEEAARVARTINRADVLLSTAEPKTRGEFMKYAIAVTMDPNTMHQYLVMSNDHLKVTNTNKVQGHPPHPDRFKDCWQCLGTEVLTGRHYWEVEWHGEYVDIAIAYPDINRQGDMERRFGLNNKTWCLQAYSEGCHFRFNEIGHEIPTPVRSRVGVYLDHGAGLVSWWSVSDTMTLLKRVQHRFVRPIIPGFWVCDEATMEMCHDIVK